MSCSSSKKDKKTSHFIGLKLYIIYRKYF